MITAIWVGVAGFFGALTRYAVQGLVSQPDETFPWGTFAVNVGGSFLLGLLVALFSHRVVVHADLRVALTVGFLGSYTTFSTLMLESYELGETGLPWMGMVNVTASIVAGFIALWLGLELGNG